MAIYSFNAVTLARTKRLNNAVAHAAYINRIDLDNNRDGTKSGVMVIVMMMYITLLFLLQTMPTKSFLTSLFVE
ncbi:hypothetical protein AB2G02_25990 (plasmid) [Escherichia coli]